MPSGLESLISCFLAEGKGSHPRLIARSHPASRPKAGRGGNDQPTLPLFHSLPCQPDYIYWVQHNTVIWLHTSTIMADACLTDTMSWVHSYLNSPLTSVQVPPLETCSLVTPCALATQMPVLALRSVRGIPFIEGPACSRGTGYFTCLKVFCRCLRWPSSHLNRTRHLLARWLPNLWESLPLVGNSPTMGTQW